MVTARSDRAKDFEVFSDKVIEHIDNYTVPQYGDKGSDLASDDSFGHQDCIKAIQKYAMRAKSNSRAGQEKLDLLKIAHYAQMAHTKLEEAEQNEGLFTL